MSTVFLMRFNNKQAACIADESTWHLSFKYGYRRSNYGDHILNLMENDLENMAAVYAGTGFPSFHFEVAEKCRAVFKQGISGEIDSSSISDIIHNEYQGVHARMMDDALRFYFGFNRDELNSLEMKRDGKTYSIKQESIIQEAKKFLHYQSKSDNMIRIFENSGAALVYTPEEGIQGYHLTQSNKGIDFATALAVIGQGESIATHIFAKVKSRMNLFARRSGFSLSEGMALLLGITANTRSFQGKMGGYFQLAWMDGSKVTEISGHNLKLATEIASALSWNLLGKDTALALIDGLLFHHMNFEEAEQEMFSKSTNVDLLQKCLLGYKMEAMEL